MRLSSLLIQSDYKVVIATLSVDGRKGKLSITQTSQQVRTDVASVIVKLESEKPVKQKINTIVDVEDLQEYLSEFYIDARYVVHWTSLKDKYADERY